MILVDRHRAPRRKGRSEYPLDVGKLLGREGTAVKFAATFQIHAMADGEGDVLLDR